MELLRDRLKYLYTSQKITQKQFANLIGIGQSTFNNYLTGIAEPNFKQLTILLKSLPNLNAEWLMTGNGIPYREDNQHYELSENMIHNIDYTNEKEEYYKSVKDNILVPKTELEEKRWELAMIEIEALRRRVELLEKENKRKR